MFRPRVRRAALLAHLSLLGLVAVACVIQEAEECESDADCKGTRVCDDGECVRDDGVGGESGGGSGRAGSASGRAGASDAGEAGASTSGSAGTSGTAGSAGTNSTAGTSGSVGAAGESGAGGSSGTAGGGASSGTGGGGGRVVTPATCPVPAEYSTAPENPGYDDGKDEVALTFSNGTLVALDDMSCTLDTSGVVPSANSNEDSLTSRNYDEYACHEGFDCEGCLVFLVSDRGPNEPGRWYLVGAATATADATPGCPDYSGRYSFCVPSCDDKKCGDNDGCGGVCQCSPSTCCTEAQECVVDECADCLSTCFEACEGIPDASCTSSCCTGSGCQCAGVCPGPCAPL